MKELQKTAILGTAHILPSDMVCLRNICINTLHKGDNGDDNDDNYNDNNNNNNNNNIIVTISFGCILYCGCFNLFYNVWVCVCVGVLAICTPVFIVFRIVFTVFLCIVPFMYIYSYLFCLYLSKDYCHRVTTQLQLLIIIIIIIIQLHSFLNSARYGGEL